jgi:hypothetical protein
MIALVAILGHATSWFGAASPHRSGLNPVAEVGGLLSGADSVVSLIVAWLVLLLAFELLCCVVTYMIGEFKLRRLYDRPARRRFWVRGTGSPIQRPSDVQFPTTFPSTEPQPPL